MLLTVFDIDGTLCRTSGIDDSCWARAAREVLGVGELSTDWSDYPHSTDESIASALIREHLEVEPTRERLDHLRDHFVALLVGSHQQDPRCITATPGAIEILDRMRGAGHAVAIATGGWTASARLKLEESGITWRDVPAAFACDAHPREEIISIAARRSADSLGIRVEDFSGMVYFGDGLWDLAACRSLGIGFIGVAGGRRAAALRTSGARFVIEDFRAFPELSSTLERHGSDPRAFFLPAP